MSPFLCLKPESKGGAQRGLRQVSLGEEEEIALKPFDETLRVTKPAQESLTRGIGVIQGSFSGPLEKRTLNDPDSQKAERQGKTIRPKRPGRGTT